MKKILYYLFIPASLFTSSLYAQIQNVIVEKYYITDANDATDTTDGRTLDSGSVTYRVFIDLLPGSKIKKIYGDSTHLLKIESTADFYNNIDRPHAYFGYLINKYWFTNNPALSLDSWLTLGLATTIHQGVLKTDDADGSIIGGSHNNGGTAGIPGGLLVNADTSLGIPLTTADGLVPDTNTFGQWVDAGFRDALNGGNDTTVFGSVNTGSHFISNSAYLQQNSGVSGISQVNNKVLVAQLTTKGELSFELNVLVVDAAGNEVYYIAKGRDTSFTQQGTGAQIVQKVSAFLSYPPTCGCRDANYLEFSNMYACDNTDSCHHLIVFGCMDTMACNYNPNANYNIGSLCCYPGYCNDRDISVVCESNTHHRFSFQPNPVQHTATIQITLDKEVESKYVIYDSRGTVVFEKELGMISGLITERVDLAALENGLYLFRFLAGDYTETKKILKN
jgi:hypothetical protein